MIRKCSKCSDRQGLKDLLTFASCYVYCVSATLAGVREKYMQSLTVPGEEAGRRIDKYLMKYFDAAPKSFIYKAFRKKNIKLCGKKAAGNELLKEGDLIELFFSDETIASMKKKQAAEVRGRQSASVRGRQPAAESKRKQPAPEARWKQHAAEAKAEASLKKYCDIVYEDDNIIIADKHYGVLSQKAAPNDYSLNEALLDYCGGQAPGSAFVPSVVNRIDRNTTGLVCFAKTYGAARELSRLLQGHELKKYYIAAVTGHIDESRHIEAWLKKDEQRNTVDIFESEVRGAYHIETAYRPIDNNETAELGLKQAYGRVGSTEYTVLKIELITGKSHQIRAHLASTGHALLGDPKYGNAALNKRLSSELGIRAQLLHAWELIMPADMNAPLKELSGRRFKTKAPGSFKLLNS